MLFDKIISQYDEHNEALLFLIDKFPINKIIFIIDKAQESKIKEDTIKFSKIFKNIEISFQVIEEKNIDIIRSIIMKYKSAIINLTGGSRIISLLLLEISMELKIYSIYIDFLNKRRYVFKDNCRVIESSLKDISMEEVFYLSGSDIVKESTSLCENKKIIDMSRAILSNLSLWHKYKQKLYDNSVFKHNCKDIYNIDVNINRLNSGEKEAFQKLLKYLKKINSIEEVKKENSLSILFKDNYLKSFLFKSGTWLEVITYLSVKNIKEVDEVRCGVLFSWGINVQNVKNEIDVIAIKDSVLICISCKDSDKYDENALNELSIYSERLGGKDSLKILVAAKKPEKITIVERAKEMNIHLVVLEDNNINYLEKKLRQIVNENIK